MKAYLVDIGILLDYDDKEFDAYACVYDKRWGYYDTNQYYVPTLEQAKKDAIEKVANCRTYEETYPAIQEAFIFSERNLLL